MTNSVSNGNALITRLIIELIKRYIFDEKLININKKVISSKKDMWRLKINKRI